MKQNFKKEYFSKMILVTGGTGLVGAHLIYFLLKNGQKVRAIHRKNSNLEAVKQVFSYYTDKPETLFNQIEWVEANLVDIAALTIAFEEIDYVYHAAAYVSFDPKNFQKLKKSNIEGTANIVNLCLSFNVKKLCHFSSIATLGKVENKKVTEEHFWNPDDDNNVYAISKYGAEMEVWRGTQEGLDAVILNPGVILGSGFWNQGTGVLFTKVYKGLSYYTKGVMGFVDVIDVVKIALKLMKSDCKNERFILVSESSSYQELLTKAAKAFNKKPPGKILQPWMLSLLCGLDYIKSLLTGTKQMLFKSTADSLSKKRHYNNSKVVDKLNYTFTPLKETIKRITENYLKDQTP
ncbi:NAD-dependent epimerase/dehydratase family protein [uncultured Planktosalinus sp.]|uniref:NAD-dependent epimerase/dehydratase family protein n=1 Tax=uncultured Planktosalinus sp. TaxID=1810935 RepID=UPI0030DA1854